MQTKFRLLLVGVVLKSFTTFCSAAPVPIGVCDEPTLRAAVEQGGSITFQCSGTIVLTEPLVIGPGADVMLDGNGRDVTLSGGNSVRLFTVLNGGRLQLGNLTLAEGFAAGTNGAAGTGGGPGRGGAVLVEGGTLVATNCVFLENRALGGTGGPALNSMQHPGPGGVGQGGAIFNDSGAVAITNCTFIGNHALGAAGAPTVYPQVSSGGGSAGGAIYSFQGTVMIADTLLSSNRSISGIGQRFGTPSSSGFPSGGAIEAVDAELTVRGSIFSQNVSRADYVSPARGGAVVSSGGVLHLSESSFGHNRAEGGLGLQIGTPSGLPGGAASGGAICVMSGTAVLDRSAFLFNRVRGGDQFSGQTPGAGSGGAVYNLGVLRATNSTFAANVAEAGANGITGIQGGARGGALFNGGAAFAVCATFADNTVAPSPTNQQTAPVALGSGLFSTNGTLALFGTILKGTAADGNAHGSISDLGYNLSSDSSIALSAIGSLGGIDPKLGPLGFYGGAAQTMPLLAGSPALNAGDAASFPPVDQRGRARPFGPAPDLGAFESSPPYAVLGRISGQTLRGEVFVTNNLSAGIVTEAGAYMLSELSEGTYTVEPRDPAYLFIPANRSIAVGPDAVGVDFRAYRWNALSIEGISNGFLHARLAGTNGNTVRIEASESWSQWHPISTNLMTEDRYLDLALPVGTELFRMYRSVIP